MIFRHALAALALTFAPIAATAAASPARGPAVAGIWEGEGYGQIFRIGAKNLQRWQLTSISCISDVRAQRADIVAGVPRYLGAHVNNDTGATWEFTFRAGRDPDHLVMHVAGAISDILLRRVPVLPARCGQSPSNTPRGNFDIFARTFSENYPFFTLHHYDWHQVVAAHRAQINDATTPTELFAQLSDMISPLQDAHTGMGDKSINASFSGWRPPAPISQTDAKAANTIIDKNYLTTPLDKYCNDQVVFGMLKNQIGYLRIKSFGNFGASPLFSDQTAALEAALDHIFSGATGMRGLVIDVRINGGGSDNFGALIASRLTTTRYLAYSKTYRNDPGDPKSLGVPQPIWIDPSTRPGFTGPVALLISHDSVSAAETFPMALQGRLPSIPFIGENTQGVFSDVLIREMPNGFGFGLPNEIYLTRDGKAYDVVGVPPTVRIPVFTPHDLAAHRDPALQKAIDLLAGG